MIIRRQSWQIDMASAIEAAAAMPFAWGLNDCSLFTCDVIKAMTDVDLAAAFRGTYSDAAGAAAAIADATAGGDLESLAAQICTAQGLPDVDVNFAWRGDIALHDIEAGPCLGIFDGEGAIYLSEFDGLVMIPRTAVRRAWRV